MRILLAGSVAMAFLAGAGCSENADLRDRVERLERSNRELAERVETLERSAPSARRIVEGKIASVEEGLGLVILSVGRESGVSVGDEFAVLRGGVSVGRIRIDRSEPHWSAGSVLDPAQGLKVGDKVSNRPPARPERP